MLRSKIDREISEGGSISCHNLPLSNPDFPILTSGFNSQGIFAGIAHIASATSDQIWKGSSVSAFGMPRVNMNEPASFQQDRVDDS